LYLQLPAAQEAGARIRCAGMTGNVSKVSPRE
jgi:hypothetical protein